MSLRVIHSYIKHKQKKKHEKNDNNNNNHNNKKNEMEEEGKWKIERRRWKKNMPV